MTKQPFNQAWVDAIETRLNKDASHAGYDFVAKRVKDDPQLLIAGVPCLAGSVGVWVTTDDGTSKGNPLWAVQYWSTPPREVAHGDRSKSRGLPKLFTHWNDMLDYVVQLFQPI